MHEINWQKCERCRISPSDYPSCPFVQSLDLQWFEVEKLQCQFIDFLLMTGFVLATPQGLQTIEPFDIIPELLEQQVELMKKHGYDRARYDTLLARYSSYLWRVRESLIANHPKSKAERLIQLTQSVNATAK